MFKVLIKLGNVEVVLEPTFSNALSIEFYMDNFGRDVNYEIIPAI